MSEELLDEGQQTGQPGNVRELPNATAVLVLGIVSIATCFCYGVPGLVCGIIALTMAKKAKVEYNANPSAFTEASFKNMNAGRICAIVGIVLSSLYFLFLLIYFLFMGTMAFMGAGMH